MCICALPIVVKVCLTLCAEKHQHSQVFPDEEKTQIILNMTAMRNDVQLQCADLYAESHHGHPTVINTEQRPDGGMRSDGY